MCHQCVFTCAKEVVLFCFVSLETGYAKTTGLIFMKFGRKVHHEPRKDPLNLSASDPQGSSRSLGSLSPNVATFSLAGGLCSECP